MNSNRIQKHPILNVQRGKRVQIYWKATPLFAYENETIASALIANGIRIFGYHKKDDSPQGLFCANGQCSQCMLLVNGIPKKACMEPVQEGMEIKPLTGLYTLPGDPKIAAPKPILTKKVKVLIIGGGPAGLSAAVELGENGVDTLIVDDKAELGGKLLVQTHRFFGSSEMVYAGTRGIDIAKILTQQVEEKESVEIWTNSPAVGIFSDKKIGVLKNNDQYALIEAEVMVIATGAREKSLCFPGNTLPGIYGAGAFQTLLNRDLVIPSKRIFIVGGGNVGLITAYHAIQAGIEVAGIAEILPECGGYKVHLDKLKRLGVPIYTSHSIVRADGHEQVESITIAEVKEDFSIIEDSHKTIACDNILIATGLNPVNELYQQAKDFGFKVFAAGDAREIAEASAAIVSGKIIAHQIMEALSITPKAEIDEAQLLQSLSTLSSKPGKTISETNTADQKPVYPVLHCLQEIPCDPCSALCVFGLIQISPEDIMQVPAYVDPEGKCKGCAQCVIGCPGLAITLVDRRKDSANPLVSLPIEILFDEEVVIGKKLPVTDIHGEIIGKCEVISVKSNPKMNHTRLVQVKAPAAIANKISGIQITQPAQPPMCNESLSTEQNDFVCSCEHVSPEEIRKVIRSGITDLNVIKAVTRAGMGACGGKTCENLILGILREEGVPEEKIRTFSKRPLFIEISVNTFLGNKEKSQ